MEKKEKTNTGKYHVTRHPDGGWQVILGGGSKVTRRTKTQEEAFKIAKEFAENKNSTVYLHGKKGSIRTAASFKKEEEKPVKKQKEEKVAKKVKEVPAKETKVQATKETKKGTEKVKEIKETKKETKNTKKK